ncbi:hypothetical protein ABIA03_000207 [Bradyrhizobium yuanmingense]|uniref:Uncharacterized protein n=1 Tax=Bradyrhizobium yuanmingense TaxID=108015 RepID=A0ABV4G713_9BRAD
MRIFSSAEYCRRVWRRMSFSTWSADALRGPDFCFIFASGGYDEPEILYAKSPVCLTGPEANTAAECAQLEGASSRSHVYLDHRQPPTLCPAAKGGTWSEQIGGKTPEQLARKGCVLTDTRKEFWGKPVRGCATDRLQNAFTRAPRESSGGGRTISAHPGSKHTKADRRQRRTHLRKSVRLRHNLRYP